MNRELLISYSFKYKGEYNQIVKAIKSEEDVEIVSICNAITILDDNYPKCLFDLKYPPFVLYYKGDLNLLNELGIGVVGSRNPCEYALKATEALVKKNSDLVIISGLAKGIDACAHKYANKTIGILGCGIDYIYPQCNYDLIKSVARFGLVLSEYPTFAKPLAYHFPFRNRIIAALSDRVYVMQSSAKSGTMTTINETLELGKEVKVLPYSIFDECGVHNNHLILEGASLIEKEEIAF